MMEWLLFGFIAFVLYCSGSGAMNGYNEHVRELKAKEDNLAAREARLHIAEERARLDAQKQRFEEEKKRFAEEYKTSANVVNLKDYGFKKSNTRN